jgi:hypothetical protein
MAKVYLNTFGRFNQRPDGSGAGGAQVLDGQCTQNRVLIAATEAFSNVASLTVSHKTDYVQIVSDGTVLVWAGDPAVSASEKQAKAFALSAGTYTFEVSVGYAVHVWTA